MFSKGIIGQKINNNFDYNLGQQKRGREMQSLRKTGNNWHLWLLVKYTLTQPHKSSSLTLEVLFLSYSFPSCFAGDLFAFHVTESRFHTILVSEMSSDHWVIRVTVPKVSLFWKSCKGLGYLDNAIISLCTFPSCCVLCYS